MWFWKCNHCEKKWEIGKFMQDLFDWEKMKKINEIITKHDEEDHPQLTNSGRWWEEIELELKKQKE